MASFKAAVWIFWLRPQDFRVRQTVCDKMSGFRRSEPREIVQCTER